jgi:hypothetical protein
MAHTAGFGGVTVIRCAAVGALVGSVAGCSVSLKHDPLNTPPQTYNDTVATARQAQGIDGKVGWGHGTLFYIPIVPIYIVGEKDDNEQVADQIRDALRQVGYNVTTVDPSSAPGGPVLKCKVNKFWFNNYTWLFPFVPTWGDIELAVSVESPGKGPVWSHTFTGHGWSANFFNGYTSASSEAMTKILNDMVHEFSSEQFDSAVKQV